VDYNKDYGETKKVVNLVVFVGHRDLILRSNYCVPERWKRNQVSIGGWTTHGTM